MNKSTKIMFLIGLIVNILEIIALIVGIIACSIAVGASDQIYQALIDAGYTQYTAEGVKSTFTFGAVSCVFGLMLSVVVLILAIFAKKSQEQGKHSTAWPIVMIVFGVFDNLFYMIAGILCLVENTQTVPAKAQANTAPKVQAETKQEKAIESKPAAKTTKAASASKASKKATAKTTSKKTTTKPKTASAAKTAKSSSAKSSTTKAKTTTKAKK